jgi:N-acetylglucosamine kinase-like BadF-type ATPase
MFLAGDIFLGMDGGGSNTNAVVMNAEGDIIAQARAGSINYRSVGLAQARAQLQNIMRQLNQAIQGHTLQGGVIGNAALSSRADRQEIVALTNGIIPTDNIIMDSDLFIALEAMEKPGPCAVVVSGTGSMAAGRTSSADAVQHTGGWGFLLGDEGSGFHLAWEGLRAAVRGWEGTGPKTTLTEAMAAHYNVKDTDALLHRFYEPIMQRSEIAAFGAFVLQCAETGDNVAQSVEEKCSDALVVTLQALCKRLPGPIIIGLWGGVFQKSLYYRSHFSKKMMNTPEVSTVGLLPCAPEVAASKLALRSFERK